MSRQIRQSQGPARLPVAAWLMLACALVMLGGCFERHEPANPFIGPNGASEEGSFGLRSSAAPARGPLVLRTSDAD